MKAIVFGATGTLGRGVLMECIADPAVAANQLTTTVKVGRAMSVLDPKDINALAQ